VTATEAPVADPAPLLAALRRDAEDGLVPFSCPGHKRGQRAAGEPSSGNHAYLLAAVGPGDEVVVGRNLHTSLLVGLILTGARPVCVAPRAHPELGLGLGVDPGDVAAAHARRCPTGPWPPAPTARSPAPTRCCRASASPRSCLSAPAWSTRPGSPPARA
jgi:arginine/lysine/ornithine decarboxylase